MTALRTKSAFTLVEILVVIAILAILAAVTFVVINPIQRINDAQDATRREDAQAILQAISLYSVDNNGELPTAGGSDLPEVTTSDVMTDGVDATTLEGISPDYLTTIPTDPAGNEYHVGQGSNGAVIVGIELTDETVFTAAE